MNFIFDVLQQFILPNLRYITFFFFLLYTQDNTKLEVRHWFGWQTNNALAVRDGIFPSYFHDFKGFLSL